MDIRNEYHDSITTWHFVRQGRGHLFTAGVTILLPYLIGLNPAGVLFFQGSIFYINLSFLKLTIVVRGEF